MSFSKSENEVRPAVTAATIFSKKFLQSEPASCIVLLTEGSKNEACSQALFTKLLRKINDGDHCRLDLVFR